MHAPRPDSPIRRPDEDQFGRDRLAQSVADLLHHAPAGSSMRVGIYGEWGEGRTSVLRLIEHHVRQHGHACARLALWMATSPEQVWGMLVDAVTEQVDAATNGDPATRAAFPQFHRVGAADGERALTPDESLTGERRRAPAGRNAAVHRDELRTRIHERLGERKVAVFVDDLDRMPPANVPTLLVSLEQLFDFPSVHYVLALSPTVAKDALTRAGFGGEHPGRFLDRIVELPVHLPAPDGQAVDRFIDREIASLGEAVRVDVLRDLAPLLSPNPRKVKSFLRYLSSLQTELRRFASHEVNWRMLYLAQMLRSEFPDETRRLAEDHEALQDIECSVARHGGRHTSGHSNASANGSANGSSNGSSNGHAQDEHRRPEEAYVPEEGDGRHRFLRLCSALREQGGFLSGRYRLREMLRLVETPPALTWLEANELFAEYVAAGSTPEREAVVAHWIGTTSGGEPDAARAAAVFRASLELRGALLDAADDAEFAEDAAAAMAQADEATALLRSQIDDLRLFDRRILGAESWIALFHHLLKWCRVHRQSEYADLRRAELRLLEESALALPTDTQLAVLETNALGSFRRVGDEPAVFIKAAERLESQFATKGAGVLLERFTRPEGLDAFWGIELHLKGKHHLFDAASPFHAAAARRQLKAVAGQAREQVEVQKNFITYFRMLCYGAFEGRGSFPRIECRQLLKDRTLVRTVWKAAVAQPVSARIAAPLRSYRETLLQTGILASDLLLPAWWRRLEKSAFGPDGARDVSDAEAAAVVSGGDAPADEEDREA